MDALFFRQQQLVSDVQSYSNSTRNDVVVNSSSSFENSATDRDRNQNPYFLDQPTQECFSSLSVTEDEDHDHFSAASSSNHYRHPPHPHTATVSTTSIDQRFSHFIKDLNFKFSDNWASELLLQTAIAITDNNTSRIQQFMWMLNELGSPYGDTNQKLAFYFLQAMFSRVIDSGDRCYRSLVAVSEKRSCFELTRRIELKFQEMSPWMTFGHVASNGAIMEAFEGERKLHIIDISNSFCTQWPTLLEALATRSNAEIPHLKLTMLITAKSNTTLESQKVRNFTRSHKFSNKNLLSQFYYVFYRQEIKEIKKKDRREIFF
ncbi:protein SHORT-ROOT-like isoform X2 [Momordica charantia]|uniref:Protein SHORT-ROOT-like isoform X2 n=1 Tax=Momordica charantia TaxID=3673 RepID=A0A6J1D8N4_MOMCH|nr:protein SHORT-ROOT-like isoform X2 [Momordica charantia]